MFPVFSNFSETPCMKVGFHILKDFPRLMNEGRAIRLVFKNEDRSDLKFYRPISLLDADVKIITKTPALRLGKSLLCHQ